MSHAEELYVGLMSGTSVDGIDAALVAFQSSSKLTVLETQLYPFPTGVRSDIDRLALNSSRLFNNEDSPLHDALANYYADAALNLIDKAGLNASNITAIANHGQTVRHEPSMQPPFSLQLGNGQHIANKTNILTICQFRQADLAVGGQGAPLMPAFHNAIFGDSHGALVLNLGGIANITVLGKETIGFDTGPANCLLDQWVNKHTGKRFDKNGKWAASGKVIANVLESLMQDQYFSQSYPKSTGTDYFNLDWLNSHIASIEDHRPEDIQATLLALTVESIKHAITHLKVCSSELYVCGGGANNSALMNALAKQLDKFSVKKTDKLGVPTDWVEAVGFAWLGYCFNHNLPSNLPSVTGASRRVVLGEAFTPQA